MYGGGCHTTFVVLLDERSNDTVEKKKNQAIASLQVFTSRHVLMYMFLDCGGQRLILPLK